MKNLVSCCLLALFARFLPAQPGGCDALLRDAQALAKNQQFDDAVRKVDAAKGCATPDAIEGLYVVIFAGLKKQTADAQNAKNQAIELLEQIKTEQQKTQAALAEARRARTLAQQALEKLEAQQEKTQEALVEAETARAQADSALLQSTKLTNIFVFYADRFSLAYGSVTKGIFALPEKFYFIDKNGDFVEKLGRWPRAEPFDDSGFAKTSKWFLGWKDYLLDTMGNSYPVAYSTKEVDSNTKALILDGNLGGLFNKKITKKIFRQGQLNIVKLNNFKNKDLSTAIGNLKNLTYLGLSDNKLTQLPPQIGNLKKLTHLDLGRNQFTNLPPEIGNLEELTHLDLDSNQFTDLPDSVGALKNLTDLNLSQNQLYTLPTEIRNLENLKHLDLSKNPIPNDELRRIQKLLPKCEIEF